jgi:hypothetical protein
VHLAPYGFYCPPNAYAVHLELLAEVDACVPKNMFSCQRSTRGAEEVVDLWHAHGSTRCLSTSWRPPSALTTASGSCSCHARLLGELFNDRVFFFAASSSSLGAPLFFILQLRPLRRGADPLSSSLAPSSARIGSLARALPTRLRSLALPARSQINPAQNPGENNSLRGNSLRSGCSS